MALQNHEAGRKLPNITQKGPAPAVGRKPNGKCQMKTVSRVIFGICLPVVCSGCMATKSVTNIGVRYETLQPRAVLMASNGSIAIECTAYYHHPSIRNDSPAHVLSRASTNNADKTKKEYLLGTPELVLSNAVASETFRPRLRLISSDSNTLVVNLHYVSTNAWNWVLISGAHEDKDATLLDLPPEFRDAPVYPITTNTASGSFYFPVPYNFSGQNYKLIFPWIHDERTVRRWWGYPAQILIIPAFAIDAAASPVELALAADWGYLE